MILRTNEYTNKKFKTCLSLFKRRNKYIKVLFISLIYPKDLSEAQAPLFNEGGKIIDQNGKHKKINIK